MPDTQNSRAAPDDRGQWDRAWRAMPHRRLKFPLGVGVGRELLAQFGTPVSFTIAQAPAQFADRCWRESEACPVCGGPTTAAERIPASLYPRWASGIGVGIGVWVHRTCFEGCPEAGEPAPVPW
jgi:hypothetical protein